MKQDERHAGVVVSLLTYDGRYEGIAEIVRCFERARKNMIMDFPLYIPQESSSPIPALPLREILVALQV